MDKAIVTNRLKRKGLVKINWPVLFFVVLASALFTLPYESFAFSPLYLALLQSALSVSPFYFLVAYLESVVIAFVRAPNYGFELAVIGTLFLVTSLLPLPIKNRYFRLFFPLTLTQVTIGIFYLVHSFSLNTGVTIGVNTFLTVFSAKTLNDLTASLNRRRKLAIEDLIPLSLVLLCATGFIKDLSLLCCTLTLTVFNSLETKRSERLALLLLEVIFLRFLVKVDTYILQVVAFPFLFSLKGKRKFNLYFHIASVPLIYMATFHTFYLERTFYLVIIGPILAAVVSEYVTLFMHYPTVPNYDMRLLELETKNSRIRDYLLLLKESLNREPFNPEHKMTAILDHELCDKCPTRDSCPLRSESVQLITNKVDIEVSNRIKRICLYPNKFIYRIKNLKPYYEREKMKYEVEKEEKENRDQEIDRLLAPLESSLSVSNHEVDLINPLEMHGIKDVEIEMKDNRVLIRSLRGLDTKTLEFVVSSTLKAPYRAIYNQYSFVEHRHLYELTPGLINRISSVSYKKSYGAQSGDVLMTFDEGDIKNIVIADGMGHGDDAYKISTYLVDVFRTVLLLGHDPVMAINETNRLLKLKSESEDYATLDYLALNTTSLEGRLYKFGSYISYLFRDNILYEYDKIYLPLGISEEQENHPTHIRFKDGDIFLMASDGLSYIDRTTLSEIFKREKELEKIKTEIVRTIPEKPSDDISFILLKIR